MTKSEIIAKQAEWIQEQAAKGLSFEYFEEHILSQVTNDVMKKFVAIECESIKPATLKKDLILQVKGIYEAALA